MWYSFSDKGSDENCFESFGCSIGMLCCYQGCFVAIYKKNKYQIDEYQLDKGDNICYSETKRV